MKTLDRLGPMALVLGVVLGASMVQARPGSPQVEPRVVHARPDPSQFRRVALPYTVNLPGGCIWLVGVGGPAARDVGIEVTAGGTEHTFQNAAHGPREAMRICRTRASLASVKLHVQGVAVGTRAATLWLQPDHGMPRSAGGTAALGSVGGSAVEAPFVPYGL